MIYRRRRNPCLLLSSLLDNKDERLLLIYALVHLRGSRLSLLQWLYWSTSRLGRRITGPRSKKEFEIVLVSTRGNPLLIAGVTLSNSVRLISIPGKQATY